MVDARPEESAPKHICLEITSPWKFNSSPWTITIPKRKDDLLSTIFQGRAVKLRRCSENLSIHTMYVAKFKECNLTPLKFKIDRYPKWRQIFEARDTWLFSEPRKWFLVNLCKSNSRVCGPWIRFFFAKTSEVFFSHAHHFQFYVYIFLVVTSIRSGGGMVIPVQKFPTNGFVYLVIFFPHSYVNHHDTTAIGREKVNTFSNHPRSES